MSRRSEKEDRAKARSPRHQAEREPPKSTPLRPLPQRAAPSWWQPIVVPPTTDQLNANSAATLQHEVEEAERTFRQCWDALIANRPAASGMAAMRAIEAAERGVLEHLQAARDAAVDTAQRRHNDRLAALSDAPAVR